MFPRPIIAITLVVAFISQDVSGGNVTNSSSSSLQTSTPSPTVSNFSRTVTTQITTSTRSQNQTASTTKSQTQTATTTTNQTQTVTTTTTKTISPSSSTTVVPTSSPKPTCGTVSFVWKKLWSDSYENNNQFVEQTNNTLTTALKDKVFNDTSKYDHVKVSELMVKKKGDSILVEFKLCLVMQDGKEGYLVDELKKWKKFVNESVTEVDFGASEVTLTDWKAKGDECNKCSDGGGGPFTIERKCKPKKAEYSCNGVKTMMKSADCLEYCSTPTSGAQKISSFDFVLGILLALSVNFWK